MKLLLYFTLVSISLNSLSKEKINDNLLINLRGMGCGIFPSNDNIDYNIKYLESVQQIDSNNIFAYRHCATQYYYLFAREKDSLLKDNYRLKAILNNIKVLDFRQINKPLYNITLNNLILLYTSGNDCQNVKLYYSRIKKKVLKSFDKGTVEYIKKFCDLK